MPFKKGKSGNQKGRPKRQDSLADIIRTIGAQCKGKDKRSRWELLTIALFEQAETGSAKAATFLAERAFGKSPQEIDLKTENKINEIATVEDLSTAIEKYEKGKKEKLLKNSITV